MNSMITKNGTEIRCLTNDHLKAYVVISENRCYLVDTGASNMKKTLINALNQMKIKGLNFEAIILTHSHSDHAANASQLKTNFKIPVFAHKLECAFIEQGKSAPIIGTTSFTRGISKVMKGLPMLASFKPCSVDYKLDQNQTEIGKGIKVIHTAGHTEGSVTVCVDDEVALVGDALFGINKSSIMPAFLQDQEAVFESWKILSNLNCRVYIPSHGRFIMKEEIDHALEALHNPLI